MANSFVTAQWVGRKALTILHAKAAAAARTNRNYQNEFTPIQGVPRGTTINVRLPFRYTLRTGPALSAQNSVQRYAALTLNNQFGVDINFSSIERSMDLGDFAEQVLEPAMAQVAAGIENSICALSPQFPKIVNFSTTASSVTFSNILRARQWLTQALAPDDGSNRTLLVDPQHNYEWILNNSTLYNPQVEIADQWISGIIASKVANFMTIEETKMPSYTSGAYTSSTPVVGATAPAAVGAGNAFASTVTVTMTTWASGATTLKAGDVLTFSGVYDVDPETQVSHGYLKQFTVTATVSDSSGTVTAVLSPAAISSGSYQNVSAPITAGLAVGDANGNIISAGSLTAQTFRTSLAFYRDAILFACVPMLDVSDTVKMCAAESYDGFNIRFIQVYDQNNDLLPGRLDTLSGEIVSYPELGARIVGN